MASDDEGRAARDGRLSAILRAVRLLKGQLASLQRDINKLPHDADHASVGRALVGCNARLDRIIKEERDDLSQFDEGGSFGAEG